MVLNSQFLRPPAALCLPNSHFASVLVHFWHEPCFPCLRGGRRVGDHLFSLETAFSPLVDFLVGKLVFLVFGPHLRVSHHTTSLLSMWRPPFALADQFLSRRPLALVGRPRKVVGRPPFLVSWFPPVLSNCVDASCASWKAQTVSSIHVYGGA